jgi:hypothetical protein
MSYKYGFTPDIAIFMDKTKDTKKIINTLKKENINFSYKMGAIKELKNINFSNKNYKSLSMNISLMGLYFNKDIYMNIDNSKCLIVDIKNLNQNWIFYLSNCKIPKRNIVLKTKDGEIPFKVRKRKDLYKLKTKNLSVKQNKTLYKYLINIVKNFEDINHIGISPSNIMGQKRILRDYLGIIFNKNPSFISALVSKNIYKEISWLKRENVFIDINMSGLNQKIFVYNEFYNAMNTPILLTRFDPKIFGNNYSQFIYLYSQNKNLLSTIKEKFPTLIIKIKNELLRANESNSKIIKQLIIYLEFFILIIALLISSIHLSKFYKRFQKTLLITQSFGYKIYIYSYYLIIAIIISSILAYSFFYWTNELINQYMQDYFYPPINIYWFNTIYIIISIVLFFSLILILENIEYKGLKNEH